MYFGTYSKFVLGISATFFVHLKYLANFFSIVKKEYVLTYFNYTSGQKKWLFSSVNLKLVSFEPKYRGKEPLFLSTTLQIVSKQHTDYLTT